MKLASLVLALVAFVVSSCVAPQARTVDADMAISGLSFLTGTWVLEQPNGAVIEETWSAPRGKAVLGSFRRVLGNGATPFYEFTQIVAAQEGVLLRQIHVHGNFDTDPRRAKPMTLRLESLVNQRASFVPVADAERAAAGSLARVSYERVDDQTLVLTVESLAPAPDKPAEPALVFRMTRAAVQ